MNEATIEYAAWGELFFDEAAHADLAIELDVLAPEPHQVEVSLAAQGLPASITRCAAGLEGELRHLPDALESEIGETADKYLESDDTDPER